MPATSSSGWRIPMTWTIQQLAILAWFAANAARSLVVRARAGCGKTTTIVEGIRRYVAAYGKTVKVLATSFATKITEELKGRLADLAPTVEVRGLHSLGNFFIGKAVGYKQIDASTRKYDIAKQIEPSAPQCVIKVLAELHTLAREQVPFAKCGADLLALAERFDCVCNDELTAAGWDNEGLCEAAYDCMVYASKNYRVIDFADQIFLPLRNGWGFPVYDLIVVDETQDMTPAQLALALMGLKKTGRMCIVGDDQQAIFEFRGADVNGLDTLGQKLGAEELGLTITRRCPKSHVREAAKIVPDFTAADDAPEGIFTDMKYAKDEMLTMATPGDFILSRTNAPLVPLCLNFLKRNIRAYVAGKKFGSTLTAIVRKLKIGADMSQLATRLNQWLDTEESKVKGDKRAQDEKWLDAALDLLNDKSACIIAMAEGCLTDAELIGRINTLCQDSKDIKVPSIMLSTVHKAKGLESDRVWLCEGTFQYRSDEDARVRYVALTRSKNELHLVKGFEKDQVE